MDDTKDRPLTREELTSPQPDSTDPAYLAWRKAKIRAAAKAADESPDDKITLEEMRNKLGLDR